MIVYQTISPCIELLYKRNSTKGTLYKGLYKRIAPKSP